MHVTQLRIPLVLQGIKFNQRQRDFMLLHLMQGERKHWYVACTNNTGGVHVCASVRMACVWEKWWPCFQARHVNGTCPGHLLAGAYPTTGSVRPPPQDYIREGHTVVTCAH